MDHGHVDDHSSLVDPASVVGTALVCAAAASYVFAVLYLRRRRLPWPPARAVSWIVGCAAAGTALVGPPAQRAHDDFAAHMGVHVLLGMLGPLLLALAAPVTVALRVLPVHVARQVSRMLRSPPAVVVTNPFVAALVNVGGLWVLYRTELYGAMHTNPVLHALVHAHVLLAGYLFTFAVLGGPDPAPHRPGPRWRAAALVAAIAAHNVLAKTLYADPPDGVAPDQAQVGAQLMYYAGAPVEIALIFLVCRPWLLPAGRDRTATVGRHRWRGDGVSARPTPHAGVDSPGRGGPCRRPAPAPDS